MEVDERHLQLGGNVPSDCRPGREVVDQLFAQAKVELDEEKRARLFIQMNDLVINNYVEVPLVLRKTVFAHTKALQNVNYSLWDVQVWNIANWTKS